MLNKNDLEAFRNADITALDRSQLVDITEVAIDPAAPAVDRLERFISAVKNPYCYRVGNTPVMVRFGSKKPPINSLLEDYFRLNK